MTALLPTQESGYCDLSIDVVMFRAANLVLKVFWPYKTDRNIFFF